MENKKEKLELIKDIDAIISTKWENQEEFLKFFEKMCGQYRNLYVKPYFGIFADCLAPMEVSNSAPDNVAAQYCVSADSVQICGGHLLPYFLPDLMCFHPTFDEKLRKVMYYLSAVGHEYEHNFQYQGQAIQDKIIKDKEKYKAKVDGIAGKYAWELVRGISDNKIEKEDVKAIFEVNPSYDKECARYPDGYVFALYYKSFIEQDARVVETEIYKTFIKDVFKLSKNRGIKKFAKSEILELKKHNYAQGTPDYYNNMHTINEHFKLITDMMSNIKEENLIDYVQTLYQTAHKKYRIALKKYIEKGTEMEYGCFIPQDKKMLFLKALDLAAAKLSEDKSSIIGYDKAKTKHLKLIFTQWGLWNSSMIEPLLPGDYFNLLKQDNITFNSFNEQLALLSDHEMQELISTYISKGQTEFCNSLILEAESLIYSGRGNYNLYPASIILQETTIQAIEKRLKDTEKTKVFDDIDDCIAMLANFCDSVGIPYYRENLSPENIIAECHKRRGSDYKYSPRDDEFRKKLFGLYQQAEKLGYAFVCKMEGHQPRPDQYRYAHAGDRAKYTLQGKKADERFKEIYGPIAYNDMLWHRQEEKRLDKNKTTTLSNQDREMQ